MTESNDDLSVITNEKVVSSYYTALISTIHNDISTHYYLLLNRLGEISYTPHFHMDFNRQTDGIILRKQILSLLDIKNVDDISLSFGDCSVLEMMIALSNRCEFMMSRPDMPNRTDIWFWNMIKSMGLDSFKDGTYGTDEYEAITLIVQKMMDNNIQKDGKGGLFYIPKEYCRLEYDARKTDIWYQMCEFVEVNTCRIYKEDI